MGKKIGIDLGTTYSCMSYVDDMGVTRIIDSSEGGQTTPSVVYFDPETNEVVVGSTARSEGGMHPECIVERVKNYMGDPGYTLNINGQEYSPAAVSKLILQRLIKDAEIQLGEGEIEGAVITCPAYFGDAAREATKTAGENVVMSNGQTLKVLQILDEPVAAAIRYADSLHEDVQKNILVYDLGGGTFDVAVAKISFVGEKKAVEILTTNGDHQLGGKDWDSALTDYVIYKFCEITGADADEMRNNLDQRQWFSENIEKTKITLTQKERKTLIPKFGGWQEKIEITREIFDAETEGLLNQTIQLLNDMMEKKGLTMSNDIDEILLVGGSTRMPQIERRLQKEYNKPIVFFEPDKAVAMGAALVASGLQVDSVDSSDQQDGNVAKDFAPMDGDMVIRSADGSEIKVSMKCTKSYGIRAIENGEFHIANIIMKDSEKPATKTRKDFATQVENQLALDIRVFENDSLEDTATVEESIEMYESSTVELASGLPAGAPIEVTFDLDKNGILIITVLDVIHNISKQIQPVRIGGNVNNIGMEVVGKMILV